MSINLDTSNRLTGLASGLETDTMIEGLLSIYQMKLDKQEQKSTELGWTADAYREINTLIKNFRSEYLSVLSDTNMMSASSYSSFEVNMITDMTAASITASSSAVAGTYTIDSITQLATAATTSSTNAFTGDSYSSDTTLEKLELANGFVFDANNEISFSINDETFTFSKDTTIASMMKQINSSDAGVTMRFSNLTKGFSITADNTGSKSTIEIANISGNAFAATDSALGLSAGTYTGQDAICSINEISVTQSNNTFSYDGVTYTLNDTTDTEMQFSISQDYQPTVDSIVSFIGSYNELVEKLQGAVEEDIYYDYDPLTEAQKEDMTEKEIEKWEEYAKSGVLKNDSYIKSLLSTLRSSFYSAVEGTGMNLSDIGLTTGTYSDGAVIMVDENKLLSALQNDPETVKSMFVQTSDSDTFSEEGLMVRISDALLSYTQDTTDVALDSLDNQIVSAEEKVESLEDRMKDKEKALWQKFAAMEAALSQMNSLSGWLSTLFVS